MQWPTVRIMIMSNDVCVPYQSNCYQPRRHSLFRPHFMYQFIRDQKDILWQLYFKSIQSIKYMLLSSISTTVILTWNHTKQWNNSTFAEGLTIRHEISVKYASESEYVTQPCAIAGLVPLVGSLAWPDCLWTWHSLVTLVYRHLVIVSPAKQPISEILTWSCTSDHVALLLAGDGLAHTSIRVVTINARRLAVLQEHLLLRCRDCCQRLRLWFRSQCVAVIRRLLTPAPGSRELSQETGD